MAQNIKHGVRRKTKLPASKRAYQLLNNRNTTVAKDHDVVAVVPACRWAGFSVYFVLRGCDLNFTFLSRHVN